MNQLNETLQARIETMNSRPIESGAQQDEPRTHLNEISLQEELRRQVHELRRHQNELRRQMNEVAGLSQAVRSSTTDCPRQLLP